MRTFLLILPIFSVSEKKRKHDERFITNGFLTSSYHRQCSDQVTAKGGSFGATNYGTHGEVRLENYPNHIKCHHKIVAEESCSAIRVSYQSIAVQDGYKCNFDSFRFGWSGSTGFKVTPPRCDCFGDGCNSYTYYGAVWSDMSYDYPYAWEGRGRKIVSKLAIFANNGRILTEYKTLLAKHTTLE